MTFWEMYEELCRKKDLSPTGAQMQLVTGVSSAAITGWKKGTTPKPDVINKIAKFFGVSTDYIYNGVYNSLIDDSNILYKPEKETISLTEEELNLSTRYRALSEDGKIKVKSTLIDEERHVRRN